MVYGVYGALGGGKSYSMVSHALEQLRMGNAVVTNIKLRDEYLGANCIDASKYLFIEDFGTIDPWTLPEGDRRGSGGKFRVNIIIDEAGEWLDSYMDKKNDFLTKVASWLRQSDKKGQDVFFIVQFETLLQARLRNVVARWLRCYDVSKFKLPGIGLRLPPVLRNFIVVSEFDGMAKEVIGRRWLPKSKSIYNAYDTAAFYGFSFQSSASSNRLGFNGKDYSGAVRPWPVRELFLLHLITLFLSVLCGIFLLWFGS